MNSKLLLAFLCIASLSTGCIIHDNDPPPGRSGDVTFLWMFDGLRCDEARDIRGVNITIPGESLLNGGRYGCSTNNVDGITLHDFVPGTYSYRLEAVDYRNVVIFEASGTFVINGDATVSVDLAPVGGGNQTSYAFLTWTLPGNQTCAQAGVATVDITLENEPTVNFPCTDGQQIPGLKTPYLVPGRYFIDIVAKDSAGRPLYYGSDEIVTQAFSARSFEFALVSGGASIAWRFSDGSVTFDCAQLDPSGNQLVGLNFQNVNTGEWVYGNEGDFHRCSTKPIVYSFLRPGFYKVSLYARTSNGVEYRSNPAIPSLEIRPGVYPGPAQALEVVLYRQ